ncbi:hypothetical protein ABPG72_016435 [Tetrahymena utriculariae]
MQDYQQSQSSDYQQQFMYNNMTSNKPNNRLNDEINQSHQKLDHKGPPKDLKIIDVVGNGTFGVVYKALLNKEQVVAVKRVFQDKRYKNREREIIERLDHQNIIKCKDFFETKGEKKDEVYLNLVMEYMNFPLSKVIRDKRKANQMMKIEDIRLYAYQMFKALSYLQSLNICHRDIKPQNILVNDKDDDKRLKICDFGSAKQLISSEANISYICSRYYRAPELIFKSQHYTNAIDIWSMGCVIAEMVLGEPLFPGENSLDQLVEIIRILGTPTRQQILMMNPSSQEFRFPQIKSYSWSKVFEKALQKVQEDEKQRFNQLMDLISKVLVYAPQERPSPLQALAHPFFDELRIEEKKYRQTQLYLFDFPEAKEQEYQKQIEHLKLIPNGYSKKSYS